MKKVFAYVLLLALLLPAAGCARDAGGTAESPVEGKKVAYIMQMAPSDIFEMWSDAAQKTAEKLGMEYEAFFCNGSDQQWRDTVSQCAAEGYDGLLLSHGGSDYAYEFLTGILEQYPDLKIAAFDTQFLDSSGQAQKIEGVTQFFQQDKELAKLLLDYICDTLYPEKADAKEPVNILKVWVGPDFLTSFDRRQEGYEEYEQQGLIRTVETIGPSDHSDAQASMAGVAAAALEKYENGEIDAVWCCYDLYAGGVYSALKEGGYNIPMVSVDICNEDIGNMAEEGSAWKACATTNWSYNGEFGMRVLALELAGEYDRIIDPTTGEASDWLELPGSLVTQDMVSGGDIDVANLDTVAGEGYSDRTWDADIRLDGGYTWRLILKRAVPAPAYKKRTDLGKLCECEKVDSDAGHNQGWLCPYLKEDGRDEADKNTSCPNNYGCRHIYAYFRWVQYTGATGYHNPLYK